MRLLLVLLLSSLCDSHFCPPMHYWNKSLDKCLECKTCHVTLISCTSNMNTICANVPETNHHLQRNRIHFFDDTPEDDLDEQLHSKNFINNDEIYFPLEKEHHKKNAKHPKAKLDEKHHHKPKKHFEFNDDYDSAEITDDSYLDYDKLEKPKKHKKHYEFNKNDNFLSIHMREKEEYENGKHHSIFGKSSRKDIHKVTHLKKVNSDEEELEEWLIQSKKKLKLRKDDLLKTLKEESGENDKKSIRLNSPIYESENLDSNNNLKKINKQSSGVDVNFITKFSKDEKEVESLMITDKESYRPAKPAHRVYLGEPSTVSEIIGQVKDPQDIIRDEMGKNILFEKPRFNVIPFVTSKQPHTGDVVSLPFTAAETLVWDWQAVAVVSAVVSCLVFFSVVSIYFVINARQWKKINSNYNKEIEEMSTRVALMHPNLESVNSDSRTTSLYLENITAHGKEDEQKVNELTK